MRAESSGLRAQGAGRSRRGRLLLAFLVPCALCLGACISTSRPTIKIGLVAPFEGRYRDVGYEVIYAVRLAVREANARGGVAGHVVELTALDDSGDPAMAAEQALKLTTDPRVVGVIGHWLEETTVAAAPVYAEAGLPLLATSSAALPAGVFRLGLSEAALVAAAGAGAQWCPAPCGWLEGATWLADELAASPGAPLAGPALWTLPPFATLAGDATEGGVIVTASPLPAGSTDPNFADRYRTLSNGVEPRTNAVLAYDAANVLFSAIEASVDEHGSATGAGVATALGTIEQAGLSGPIGFSAEGEWQGRAWVYRWQKGSLVPRAP